ncbi:MAG: outer membrane protein assembly factor [Myxococcales bacterium]|nr:outer membrane protein assembly factor [Myxococcales bacterium]
MLPLPLTLLLAASRWSTPLALADPGPADPEASVPTRYTGELIALRTLSAGRGRLPDENLEPLLRVQQDGRYSPADVRQDLAMLYRVAHVVQVEVDVEPWPAFDAQGNPIPAVHVDYRIFPPDEIKGLHVTGNRHLGDRVLLAAIRLNKGGSWFPEDLPTLAAAIHDAYSATGWPDARARIVAADRIGADGEPAGVDVDIAVTEGEPHRITTIGVKTNGAVPAWRARLILLQHHIAPGRTWTDAQVRIARDALATTLHSPRRSALYEAKVSIAVGEAGDAAVYVDPRRTWTVDPGATGVKRSALIEALDLVHGARLTRTFDADATDTLNSALRAAGHLGAAVTVQSIADAETVAITLAGSAGPRSRPGETLFVGPAGALDADGGERIWTQRYLRAAFLEAQGSFGRGRVTPQNVDKALAAMREFYRTEGYLGATFLRTPWGDSSEGGKKARREDVRVEVTPGPRAWLRSVSVTGGVDEIDAEAVWADLLGTPVNPSGTEARARQLVDRYGKLGYLRADATSSLAVSPDGTRADLTIAITPGAVVYLRAVLIRGYSRTERYVIEREISLRSGDPITPDALSDIRRRLYELGVFDRVSVEAVGDEDRVKDILITLDERKNLYAEVGGGIATDQGVRVFARTGHRNLFGIAHTLTLYGQGGIGWLGDGWSFDLTDPTYRASAHYGAPHVPASGESVTGDVLFGAEEQAPDWRLSRSGVAAGLSLRIGAHATARVDYRVQWRRLLDVDPGVLVNGDPWLGALGLADGVDPSPITPSAVRRQSGIDLSFLLDLRDDPFNPTRGGVGSAAFLLTDPILSDHVYLRGEGSWTQQIPLGKPAILLRLRSGAAWVPNQSNVLPVEDRFQGGGGASFRGFGLDTLGPANLVSNEDISYPNTLEPLLDYAERTSVGRWVSTGGDAMAVGTFEFTLPLDVFGLNGLGSTRVALYTDVGNIWWISPLVETTSMSRSVNNGGDPLLRYSLGIGLRRATPVGPLQIDLAFNPSWISERDEVWIKPHVSLGSVF